MKDELHRRASLTDAVEKFFRAWPYLWHSMLELAGVGGIGGFRTRISDCRLKRGMDIEHNGQSGSKSAYRFLPEKPLGRSGEQPREQTLF